jgi:hypothetical protein
MKEFFNKLLADIRQIHRSLTMWFNGLMIGVAAGLPALAQDFPQLQDYMPHNIFHTITGALIAGNILLRFKTNSSLAAKAPRKDGAQNE